MSLGALVNLPVFFIFCAFDAMKWLTAWWEF